MPCIIIIRHWFVVVVFLKWQFTDETILDMLISGIRDRTYFLLQSFKGMHLRLNSAHLFEQTIK